MRTLTEQERGDIVRPFLRWAGGKQRLLPSLRDRLPPRHKIGTYFEPFAGAASLFLAEGFEKAWLGDLNAALINTYRQVRDVPEAVYEEVHRLAMILELYGEPLYYQVRADYNRELEEESVKQAGRFIFLNHSNFNGIYRVNKSKGYYNVPYGHKRTIHIPSLSKLMAVSQRLKGVRLINGYYEGIKNHVRAGDFVYLDPPYPVLSKTANFNSYTIDKFSEEHHRDLGAFAQELKSRGVYVMISNTDVPLIRELFADWFINETDYQRNISSKRPAIYVKEFIITNYQP